MGHLFVLAQTLSRTHSVNPSTGHWYPLLGLSSPLVQPLLIVKFTKDPWPGKKAKSVYKPQISDISSIFWLPRQRTIEHKLSCNYATEKFSVKAQFNRILFSVQPWAPPKCPFACVHHCQQISWFHLLSLHLPPPPFVCSSTTVYGLWCTVQQALKAPIISTAHVFEEVEVFQLNAKQDLLGLSLGLRHFIADSVSELAPWKFSPLETQSDGFSQCRM